MVGSIQRILNSAPPEIKEALKQKAAEAVQVAVKRADQTSQVVRSEVSYTVKALEDVARNELQKAFIELKGNDRFREEDMNAMGRIAAGIVREIVREIIS